MKAVKHIIPIPVPKFDAKTVYSLLDMSKEEIWTLHDVLGQVFGQTGTNTPSAKHIRTILESLKCVRETT